MERKYDILVGSVWPTNNYGDIEILEDLGYEDFEDRTHRYRIRFLKTNHIRIAIRNAIINGQLKDLIPDIDFEKIRDSYKCGKYQIIEYLGLINGRQCVKIRFLDSTAESIVLLYNAESGKVHDPMFGFNPNKIFQSNRSGPFKMIEYLGKIKGHAFVTIQFLNTGYIRDAQMYNALDGKVVDPTLNGKASDDFSIDRFDNYEIYLNKKLKNVYDKMIKRCTVEDMEEYRYYGALGIKVCDRWLESFDNFLEDAKLLPGYEKYYYKPYLYELDKDYLQFNIPKELRVYSPQTCIFIYKSDNINLKAIEYRDKYNPGSFFGVSVNSAGNFQVGIVVNDSYVYLGCFNDIIAAANMFNIASEWYHDYELVPLKNNVPIMNYKEIGSHIVSKRKMYSLI